VGRSPGDAGLLQRLDHGTSGVVIVARSQKVHDILVRRQTAGEMDKKYLALVRARQPGKTPPLVIDLPLAGSGPRGHRMKPSANGRSATTRVRLVSEHGDKMLLCASIRSGRRHQIRVHLASAGFPIIGDSLYGEDEQTKQDERLFLHAHQIRLVHPLTGEPIEITSELPESFEKRLRC
jgi:23S rRNA pseudouridine1911/1915/1917 synthase